MDDVALREVAEEDLPVFFGHQRDTEAARMAAFPSRDWDAFLAHWRGVLADTAVEKKTVLFGGEVAGNIVCFGAPTAREVGYWIGREHWGHGVATRALELFLGVVTTRPLYAHVANGNVASRRVLEKCGFTVIRRGGVSLAPGGRGVEEIALRLER